MTNDISLILDRGPMIGYIWSHAPPWYSSNSHLIFTRARAFWRKSIFVYFSHIYIAFS